MVNPVSYENSSRPILKLDHRIYHSQLAILNQICKGHADGLPKILVQLTVKKAPRKHEHYLFECLLHAPPIHHFQGQTDGFDLMLELMDVKLLTSVEDMSEAVYNFHGFGPIHKIYNVLNNRAARASMYEALMAMTAKTRTKPDPKWIFNTSALITPNQYKRVAEHVAATLHENPVVRERLVSLMGYPTSDYGSTTLPEEANKFAFFIESKGRAQLFTARVKGFVNAGDPDDKHRMQFNMYELCPVAQGSVKDIQHLRQIAKGQVEGLPTFELVKAHVHGVNLFERLSEYTFPEVESMPVKPFSLTASFKGHLAVVPAPASQTAMHLSAEPVRFQPLTLEDQAQFAASPEFKGDLKRPVVVNLDQLADLIHDRREFKLALDRIVGDLDWIQALSDYQIDVDEKNLAMAASVAALCTEQNLNPMLTRILRDEMPNFLSMHKGEAARALVIALVNRLLRINRDLMAQATEVEDVLDRLNSLNKGTTQLFQHVLPGARRKKSRRLADDT